MKSDENNKDANGCICSRHIINAAIHIAASRHQLSPLSIQSRSRKAVITSARHLSIYLSHVTCNLPLKTVTTAFQRERTNIRYACERVEMKRELEEVDLAITVMEQVIKRQIKDVQKSCGECR